MTDDDAAVSARLLAIREDLDAEVWPTAVEAAVSGDHERIRDLGPSRFEQSDERGMRL